MAALDLHCGLEHGPCVWAGERVDLLDSFDSEMQEWEEQLQDVQRKIEELYKEVKARRGANESGPVSSTNHTHLDVTLLPVDAADGYQGPTQYCGAGGEVRSVHPCGERRGHLPARQADALNHHGDYSNGMCHSEASYQHKGFMSPKSYQMNGSPDVTLDILNGYLGQGEDAERSVGRPGAPRAGSARMQSVQCNLDGSTPGPGNGRIGDIFAGKFEEVENGKNRGFGVDGVRHVSWKDPISSKETPPETPATKPSLRQRDVLHPIPMPAHSAHFPELLQQPDRKCSLMDRKCGSPSVLRKFGAMLQENEGKTLIEDGMVTTVISAEPSKAPSTPVCQRKFGAGWASTHVPVQKCPQDPDVLMAGLESSQQPQELHAAAGPRAMLQNGDHRGFLHPAATTNAHARAPPRAEAAGSRKPQQGPAPRVQAGLWGSQGPELQAECRMGGGSAGSPYQGKGQGDLNQGQDTRGLRDGRKWEEQGTVAYSVHQISREPSPNPGKRNFSRPARPANQRPPSRWANHAPTAKIATPSGPMSRPPSPARKAKQSFSNFSLYTETIIM